MNHNLIKKCRENIIEHKMLDIGDRVIIGLSGGADSVCLLLCLHALREEFSLDLLCAHLNHGLRGAEADRDEEFSRELCASLNVPFVSRREDVSILAKNWGVGLEEAGRRVRYTYFEELCNGEGKIAVAHHQNDQAETVLLHLLRGSGCAGLSGMRYIRGRIIRPLLSIERAEIEDFLNENNITYCEDATNNETIYARNMVRHKIISSMEEMNPSIVKTLSSMAEGMQEDSDCLDALANDAFLSLAHDENGKVVLNGKEALSLPRAILKRVIMLCASKAKDLSRVQIDAVIKLLEGQSGKKLHLAGICVQKSYDSLLFFKETKEEKVSVTLKSGEKATIGEKQIHCYEGAVKKRGTIILDRDKLSFPLVVRYKKEGDSFAPSGMDGHKTLKKYFSDEKIPLEERKRVPIVLSGEEIVWVCGMRAGRGFLPDENTKNFVTLEITEGKGE